MFTDYTSITVVPVIVTYCTPCTIDTNFNTTRIIVSAISFETNIAILTWSCRNNSESRKKFFSNKIIRDTSSTHCSYKTLSVHTFTMNSSMIRVSTRSCVMLTTKQMTLRTRAKKNREMYRTNTLSKSLRCKCSYSIRFPLSIFIISCPNQ